MTEAPDPGPGGASPSGAPHPGRPAGRGPFSRWFEPVQVARDAAAELAHLAATGSLVFVMRSAGLLGFFYLRWFLRRHGLPRLRAVQGFPPLIGWLARIRRSRRVFEEAIAGGDAALVFLGRGPERDPLAALVRQQRDLPRPVLLVPVLLVWSRRAQKLRPSVWDVLYGSPEAPSAFANAVAFLRNHRRAFFEVGRPLDLRARVAERPDDGDAVLARRIRGVLHQQLARAFRIAVGPPLKAPSRVREKVLRDRSLRATVATVARETDRTPEAVLDEASKDLREIASRYDPSFVRLARVLLSWIFGRLYTSVEVDEEGLARVKRASADAPIVLCPSHKSHVDYLVLSWLLYERGMTPPHVAAGVNLAFWPFGAIARRGGAFFIRRKVKGDRVYTAVLRAYVKHLLRDRFPQEFYVEGGRSRTGKLLFPKTGLVSMEVDAWLDGAAEDVYFVPVAIDYERLIEASSYARELSGAEKKKEDLRALLGAARVLFRRFERLYVQFEQPISLREVARARLGEGAPALAVDEAWDGVSDRAAGAAPGNGARAAPAEAKRRLVQALANRIAFGISRAITITPVGLVAAALLSHLRRGIGAEEVARRVELLRYIAANGGARFSQELHGATSDPLRPGPVADAVGELVRGGLVRVEVVAGGTIYLVVDEKRPVLDYHRNAVIHRYVSPALVAAAARAAPPGADLAEIRERALRLSRLLKLEFMYRVDAPFEAIFEETVAFLARVKAVALDGERLILGTEGWTLTFLAELVRPYLEAYGITFRTAVAALADAGVGPDRRALVRESLEQMRAAFLSGEVALRESVSKATVENAVEWLVSQGTVREGDGKLAVTDGGVALRSLAAGIPSLPAE